LIFFPWLGLVACLQPDDRVADVHRLARFHRKVAREAVTLVENTEGGNTLRHWGRGHERGHRWLGCYLADERCGGVEIVGDDRWFAGRLRHGILQRRRRDRQTRHRQRAAYDPASHAASGLHAS